MGDVLTLVEKAEQVYEEAEAETAAAKLLEGEFTLEDFLEQMRQLKKMGSPPESGGDASRCAPQELRKAEIEDDRIAQVEAIICSMTPEERAAPPDDRRFTPSEDRRWLGYPPPQRSPSSCGSSARCSG